MSTAIFKIQQFVSVIFYEQRELFWQRYRLGKVTDSILDVRFFLFGTHGRLFSEDWIKIEEYFTNLLYCY
jgi:hypothetical protein